MFNRTTYVQRREQLKQQMGSGVLIFLGNDESSMNYADNTYHFRQDSTFLYYFGFERNAGLSAVIDIDNNSEIIFGNELSLDYIVWMGVLPSIKEQAEHVGVSRTESADRFAPYIAKAIAVGQAIHTLPPYRAEHRLKLNSLFHGCSGSPEPSVKFIKAVVKQRNYKSNEEVEEIEHAVRITKQMHRAALAACDGMMEYEVMALVHAEALKNGCSISFPIICTTHGETLHNHFYGNKLQNGKMLLIDAGAELPSGYCGDLTTTIPIGGSFTSRQQAVYDVVMEAHRSSVEMLKPGIPFRDAYNKASEIIFDGMKSLGLAKGNATDAVSVGAHAMFFQCGLGHMMGLDVHDMENLGEVWVGYDGVPKSTSFGIKSLRLARKLEPGFVITVEPGVYFIPTLIDMWRGEKRFREFLNYDELEKWKDFGGIRHEEDFLITQSGHRMLGE